PGRLDTTWQKADTTKIETAAGTQTRLVHFAPSGAPSPRSWQRDSTATWEPAAGGGSLRVATSNLRAGYLRKNGVPYSDQATVTEHFDVSPLAGDAGFCSSPPSSKILCT